LDTLAILSLVARYFPTASAGTALDFIEALSSTPGATTFCDLGTSAGREKYARSLPAVTSAMENGKLIPAIKALRFAASEQGYSMSLRDAKEACDAIGKNNAWDRPLYNSEDNY
jgi:hypothetical protein